MNAQHGRATFRPSFEAKHLPLMFNLGTDVYSFVISCVIIQQTTLGAQRERTGMRTATGLLDLVARPLG